MEASTEWNLMDYREAWKLYALCVAGDLPSQWRKMLMEKMTTWSIYEFFLYGSLKSLFTLSERRHSSSSKPPLTPPSSSVFSLISSFPSKNKGSSGSGSNRSSSGGTSASSSNSKLLKSPKDKLQISGNNRLMHSVQHSKVPHDKMWVCLLTEN